MMDRDELPELYEIVAEGVQEKGLKLSGKALPIIRERFGKGCDVYFRRRLSVCRMLMDLHIPIDTDGLDILVATALSHHHPGDNVPGDHSGTMAALFSGEPRVAGLLKILMKEKLNDEDYYNSVKNDPLAMLIRLTERSVLVESLYEWDAQDARRYLRETREHFFEMCIYSKEKYSEYLGPFSILMEKTRNLVTANEAMLERQEAVESSLQMEILSYMEENAAIRAMIRELQGDASPC